MEALKSPSTLLGLGNATGTLMALLYVLKKLSDTNSRIDELQRQFNTITDLLGGGNARLFVEIKDKTFEVEKELNKKGETVKKMGYSVHDLKNDSKDMKDVIYDLLKILNDSKIEKIPEKEMENLLKRVDDFSFSGNRRRDNRREPRRNDDRREPRRNDDRREPRRDHRSDDRREPRRDDRRDDRREPRRDDRRDDRRNDDRRDPRSDDNSEDSRGEGSDDDPYNP